MKLLEILKSKEELFIIDDVEDKKTKALVKDINTSLINISEELESFIEFATSQLEGEYHKKLVNLKSLQEHYGEWNGIKVAFTSALKEEENRINKLYGNKTTLINKLKSLMADCQKSLPVVSGYHLSNNELTPSGSEHVTVIIGKHNNNIIEDIISELEANIVVEGNFNKVHGVELTANYTVVDDNIDLCEDKIDELFQAKPAKADKFSASVKSMTTAAENLVFFETYKATMLEVGCPSKDVDLMEKDLLKKYVPLKKQLQKALKVTFADISNIVVDESEFASDSEEVSTNDENFFDTYSFNNDDNSQDEVEQTSVEDSLNAEPISTTTSTDLDDLDNMISDIGEFEEQTPATQPAPVLEETNDDVFDDLSDLDDLSLVDNPYSGFEDTTSSQIAEPTPEELPVVEDILEAPPAPVVEEEKKPAKRGRKPTKKAAEPTPAPVVEETPAVEPIQEDNGEIKPLDLDTPLQNDDEI